MRYWIRFSRGHILRQLFSINLDAGAWYFNYNFTVLRWCVWGRIGNRTNLQAETVGECSLGKASQK